MKILATIFFCLAVCGSLHADPYTYTVVPLVLPSGAAEVFGLNDSGQVAGFTTTASPGFIASTSGYTFLSPLPGFDYVANSLGISNYGVAGTAYHSGNTQAFINTGGVSTAVAGPNSSATGINNSGAVTGVAGADRAFVATTSGSTLIPLPTSGGWTASGGNAINDSNQVTGFVSNASLIHAVIGTTSGSTAIPLPSGSWMLAAGYGINDSDEVAGYAEDLSADFETFIWSSGAGTTALLPSGFLDSWVQQGNPINNAGDVVLTAWDGGETMVDATGFLWTPGGGFQNLNNFVDPSWDIIDALSINNEGQILAYATNNGGAGEYILLDPAPTPEPSSLALLVTAAAGLLYTLRRRL